MRWALGLVACIAACAFAPHVGYAQQTQTESEAKIALAAPLRCAEPVAKIASIQGLVELRGLKLPNWQRAQLNEALCLNDSIRVGPNSRASFQYASDISVQLDQNTFVTLIEPKDQASVWTQMWRGALHFITRSRKPYRVITPFANASVEGTEVYIALAKDRADVTVFEGKLDVANDAGQVLLGSGESAIVQGLEAITDDDQFRQLKAEAPRKVLIAKPRDAVQWALYYPPVMDVRAGDAVHPNLKAASEQFRAGNTAEAFAELERVPAEAQDAQYLIYRASLKLYVGREQDAQADLNQALQQNAKQSDALALQAIIAVVQSDKEQGLNLAQKAVDADPTSAAAQIALSYAQQAIFKLEPALASAEQAAKLDPANALAYARIAELQLSQGDLDKALTAAKKATELNPNLARTQSILGFSYLTRIDTKNAKETFAKAIQLDSADPLPHLGLGLAKIREGKLSEGRQDIERAVILDPNNSLIRSYVGKAYYEEKRDELAGKQFEIAKELDPRDPTPYFYNATRKQAENRSAEALEDLEDAIDKNDNRRVFRSTFLLQEDAASRATQAARTYEDLGFKRSGLLEAHRSLDSSFTTAGAHRFLSDAYSQIPRHEIAQASELLQSLLWSRNGHIRLQPSFRNDRSGTVPGGIFREADFGRFGLHEYSPSFGGNGIRGAVDVLAGSDDVLSESVRIEGVSNRLSYSFGQFHFEGDRVSPNAALKRDAYSAFLQANLTSNFDAQIEVRQVESLEFHTDAEFDPASAFSFETDETAKNARLGLHFAPSPKDDLLVSAIWQDRDILTAIPGLPSIESLVSRGRTLEAQYVKTAGSARYVSGAGHFRGTDEFPIAEFSEDVSHYNLYLYGQSDLRTVRPVRLHLGISIEKLRRDEESKRHVNPKVGVTYALGANTVLRGAFARSVKRQLLGNQTIEPTQIAGFNQFFDDANGTVSRRLGVGIDHKFAAGQRIGLELSGRRLTVPNVPNDSKERWYHAYCYVPLVERLWGWQLALTGELDYERFQRPVVFTGIEGYRDVENRIIPLGIQLLRSRMHARITTSHVRQEGEFRGEISANSSGWVTDATITFRLPARHGQLMLGARNLLNNGVSFVETDSLNPRFARDRFVFGRLSVAF